MNGTMITLRAMLIFVLYTQVSHQRISLGEPTIMNWLMAITIEVSISVIASAVFTIVMGSDKRARYLSLLALPALLWCMSVSYDASVKVFHKNRLDQVQAEGKTLASRLAENRAIAGNNTMLALSKEGITSGDAYEQALLDMDAGMSMMAKYEGAKNESTTALAIGGGDPEMLEAEMLAGAKKRAVMLIVLTLALSGLAGLWNGIKSGVKKLDLVKTDLGSKVPQKGPTKLADAVRESQGKRKPVPLKKPNGPAAESIEKQAAVPVPSVPADESVPAERTVPTGTPKPSIDDESVRSTGKAKEKAIEVMAKKVRADLEAGTLVDSRTEKPLTKTISNRALSGYSTSSDSRKAILNKLGEWGVVDMKKGSAHIADKYAPVKPATSSHTADVISGLQSLGINKKEAAQYAERSSGKDLNEHINAALKLAAK